MTDDPRPAPGQILLLNGAPRSGKSAIVAVVQDTFAGVWMNLGVDVFVRHVTPKNVRPGMGLRPGEEHHPVAPLVPALYAALYDSIAAHSRHGLEVVVDVGHHDRALLTACARRLEGLPVLFVGVRCPIGIIMERRNAGDPSRAGTYAVGTAEEPVPPPVQLWQERVHGGWRYDLEVDTSLHDPNGCAALIQKRLEAGPPGSAFRELAGSQRAPE